jgi:hypothetical protein
MDRDATTTRGCHRQAGTKGGAVRYEYAIQMANELGQGNILDQHSAERGRCGTCAHCGPV